ncbi:MAG TPA: porin [Paraburkholderia sp.]
MKSWLYPGVAAFIATATPIAHAQSSVTLYGILDVGIQYTTNQGGHHSVQEASSMMRGDRWGLQGREDLGGGFKAVFRLESGFSLNNGVLGQSTSTAQRIFGRYAYVGLANDQVQVLFGRQPDFMLDYLQTTANSWYGTSLEFHPAINANFFGNNGSNPSLDRIGGGEVDSSVKATWSPVKSLSFGAMYGFGDAPGIGSPNSTQSYGATWTTTGTLVGAVYTTRKDNLTPGTLRTLGIGGTTSVGDFMVNALYTNSRWTLTGDVASIFDVGVRYNITPFQVVGVEYTFLDKNNGPKNVFYASVRSTYGVIYDYRLSKRTDIYATYVFQHATGGRQAQIFGMSLSSSSAQGVAAIGIRHYF